MTAVLKVSLEATQPMTCVVVKLVSRDASGIDSTVTKLRSGEEAYVTVPDNYVLEAAIEPDRPAVSEGMYLRDGTK